MPPKKPNNDQNSTTSALAKKAKRQTKTDLIISLLKSKRGGSIEEMTNATGWQAHSVRGFLSGTVKKRLGLNLASQPDGKGIRRYRISASETQATGD